MARRSKMGRLEVWNESSDAFKHTDLAYNFDTIDLMLGGPNQAPTNGVGDDFNNPTTTAPTGSGQWLYPQDSTTISNLGNRTLYNIVRALDYNSVPLGAVFAWWRPTIAVPLPSGCVPVDGSTYSGTSEHSYGAWGITTITLPDLRNKMILGAYETVTGASTVALSRDNTAAVSPSTNTGTDGPGIGATGGSNVPRALSHTHGVGTLLVASHTHTVSDHIHGAINHYHGIQHIHGASAPDFGFGGLTYLSNGSGNLAVMAGDLGLSSVGIHTHAIGVVVPTGTYQAFNDGTGRSGPATASGGGNATTEGMTSLVATTATQPALSGASASALSATEIQPAYVGLLYVVKIRKPGPLHNTSFPVGT